MINLISLTMKNFTSYGANTTIVDLHRVGTTLILGEDHDNTSDGAGSNGVGKTNILQALSYGMYGKPVSNISLDNLVNNINKKNMEVTVTFEKDGVFHHIERVRKKKVGAAGNYMKYFVRKGDINFTKEDEVTRDSVSHTNKTIEDAIGIPHELFCRIVVFSAIHIPFLDLPVRHPTQTCQTRIIEELFNLTSLTEKAKELSQQIKDNESRLKFKEAQVEQLEKEHERHKTQLLSAKQRVVNWEKQNKQQLKDLEAKLKKIAGIDIETQRRAHDKLVTLRASYSEFLAEQRETSSKIKTLRGEADKKVLELSHLRNDKCPYCQQKYPNAEIKIKEIEKEIATISKKKESYDQQYVEAEIVGEDLGKEMLATESKITVQNLKELLDIKSQSSSIKGRIKVQKDAENPFIEPLDELEQIELEPINHDELNKLRKIIEHQRFLYKLLIKKDSFVRKALLDRNIPYLNTRLQHYLSELGLPHTVEFTHELTAQISQFGREMDFGSLSNGQRARVNLGLSLAFRDVLQMLHAKVNVCMFDEVLDVGLDTIGVQAAARMLKRKARDEKLSLFIISHRDEIDKAFDHTMTIQLNNGFSYINED